MHVSSEHIFFYLDVSLASTLSQSENVVLAPAPRGATTIGDRAVQDISIVRDHARGTSKEPAIYSGEVRTIELRATVFKTVCNGSYACTTRRDVVVARPGSRSEPND